MTGLADRVIRGATSHPERSALESETTRVTYAELASGGSSIGATIQHLGRGRAPVAIVMDRSPCAFAAVVGSLAAGSAYVPISPQTPVPRAQAMLSRSGARTVLTERTHADIAHRIAGISPDVVVITIDGDHGTGTMPLSSELQGPDRLVPVCVASTDLAYILFTSGTTGTPKAVGVTHGNVLAFLEHIMAAYDFTPEDRFSQTFELTFDLSVFDMFACWSAGATLCLPTAGQRVNPATYIVSNELTVWFSVPSVGLFLHKLGILKPDRFPTLRRSLFCGEALPASLARTWQSAAPNSSIDNLYGPTELTIACTGHRWSPGDSTDRGLVPIGRPFPSMTALVADESGCEVPVGSAGELLMTGPQLTPGYLDDPDATAGAYVHPPGADQVYYRTGDRVRRAARGAMEFLGRIDDQVKVNGHRVELGEVEAAARQVVGTPTVAAVGHPRTEAGFGGIVLFVEQESVHPAEISRAIADRLPAYMVPRAVHGLERLPLNGNGKVDRSALVRRLEDGCHG